MHDFGRILKLMFYRSWIVVLVTGLFSGATAYYNINHITPIYQARASLYIMPKKIEVSSDSILVNRQMIKDYRELIKSYKVTSSIIDELGIPGLTPEGLAGMVGISQRNDTNVFDISVIDTNPARAKDIANTISKVFTERVKEFTNVDNIKIVDAAKQPTFPISPNKKLNVITVFMFTFFISTVGLYAFALMDNTLRSVEDVERITGYSVIGIIPKMNIK